MDCSQKIETRRKDNTISSTERIYMPPEFIPSKNILQQWRGGNQDEGKLRFFSPVESPSENF